jgi:hypothetical protein
MEMDARGGENTATSNIDGQVGNVAQNGVEGMQEHNEQVEEINIRTLKVPLSPIGNDNFDQFLAGKNMAVQHILHVQNRSLFNNIRTDFHADSPFVRFSSGLPRVRASGASSVALAAVQRTHGSRSCDAPPCGRPGVLLAAAAPNAGPPVVQEQRSDAAKAGAEPPAANGCQGSVSVGHAGDGHAGDVRCSSTDIRVGSSVVTPMMSSTLFPFVMTQTILPTAHTAKSDVYGVQANHRQDDEPIMSSLVEDQSGLGVHGNGMAPDVSPLNPNFNISSFDSDNFLAPYS